MVVSGSLEVKMGTELRQLSILLSLVHGEHLLRIEACEVTWAGKVVSGAATDGGGIGGRKMD
jgi:hypothetical protein